MKPKFTDLDRYRHGYRRADETDITKTWERAKKQIEQDKAERAEKVREIKKSGAKHG